MDNRLTTPEQKRYTIQHIRDNDLSDLRDAMLKGHPDMPAHLRAGLQGPLPTQEEIDAWLAKWGHQYLPILDPAVFERMQQESAPSAQMMGCAMHWVLSSVLFLGSGAAAYLLGWWVPIVPAVLFGLFLLTGFTAATANDRSAVYSRGYMAGLSCTSFFGALVGLAGRFILPLIKS
jgi:hypothetical protein